MKKRQKKKLAKRFGYRKYSKRKIKYQNYVNYIIELNKDVFNQAHMHRIMWGQSCLKIIDGDLKVIHIPLYG